MLPPVVLPAREPWEVQALLDSLSSMREQVAEGKEFTEQDPTIDNIEDFVSSIGLYNELLDVLDRSIARLQKRIRNYARIGIPFYGRFVSDVDDAVHAQREDVQGDV